MKYSDEWVVSGFRWWQGVFFPSNATFNQWGSEMDISINIPEHFYQTEYKSSRIPGVDDQSNLALGANCQVFAYELLKVNGFEAKNDRSSELWSDESYSVKVDRFEPLDLMLYNHNAEAYGAHVGVYIGEGKVVHLSLENGKPEITTHEQMLKNVRYQFFIGAKRIKQ